MAIPTRLPDFLIFESLIPDIYRLCLYTLSANSKPPCLFLNGHGPRNFGPCSDGSPPPLNPKPLIVHCLVGT